MSIILLECTRPWYADTINGVLLGLGVLIFFGSMLWAAIKYG